MACLQWLTHSGVPTMACVQWLVYSGWLTMSCLQRLADNVALASRRRGKLGSCGFVLSARQRAWVCVHVDVHVNAHVHLQAHAVHVHVRACADE